MSLSMHRASVPVFARALKVLATLLEKGEAHAKAQGLDGLGHRADLRVLLGELDDLGPVGGRAHAGFDFTEAVENLVEAGLGQSQGVTSRCGGSGGLSTAPSAPRHPLAGRRGPGACKA